MKRWNSTCGGRPTNRSGSNPGPTVTSGHPPRRDGQRDQGNQCPRRQPECERAPTHRSQATQLDGTAQADESCREHERLEFLRFDRTEDGRSTAARITTATPNNTTNSGSSRGGRVAAGSVECTLRRRERIATTISSGASIITLVSFTTTAWLSASGPSWRRWRPPAPHRAPMPQPTIRTRER